MTYSLTVTVADLQVGDVVVPNRYQDWSYGQSWAPVDSSGATGVTVAEVNAFPGPVPDDWTVGFNRRINGSYRMVWAPSWRISVRREGDDPDPPGDNPEFLYLDGGPGDLEPGDAYKVAGNARDVGAALPWQYLINAVEQTTGMATQVQAPSTARYSIRRPNPGYIPPDPEEVTGGDD